MYAFFLWVLKREIVNVQRQGVCLKYKIVIAAGMLHSGNRW